jgi:hypothetical protein
MLQSVFNFLTSLKLTAICLGLATVLVFAGTMAQVDQGLYTAQSRYFRSFFVFWGPPGAGWTVPVFPGGYLIGGVMLLSLVVTAVDRFRRYKLAPSYLGLLVIHVGLILLLLGQLMADVLQVESAMPLRVGETKRYSEDFRAHELAVIDVTDPSQEKVVAIPESMLARGGEIPVPGTPLSVRVKGYWINAELPEGTTAGSVPSQVSEGVGRDRQVLPRAPATSTDERNAPAATVEVAGGGSSLGSWLVSTLIDRPQGFVSQGRQYQLVLRARRYYAPFSLTLIDCANDFYPGSGIPKNFSSRVRVQNPGTGEDREVTIKMNDPLRYGGNAYYQYQMAPPEAPSKSSTLQVVRNPGWLTPYVSCLLIGIGLVWQFLTHLIGFLKERRHET